ncbi:hypothetical protein C8J56DRAFT_248470 [Mycena floridula]|nr:hypothetical protein C8J56DRAFT_248470 [Mycena floridula]
MPQAVIGDILSIPMTNLYKEVLVKRNLFLHQAPHPFISIPFSLPVNRFSIICCQEPLVMDSTKMSLESFPEELLDRILLHVVLAPAAPRPRLAKADGPSGQPTGNVALLLTSQTWLRIALPHIYHTIYLKTANQVGLLARTLESAGGEEKGALVRSLTLSSLSPVQLPNLISRCCELDSLDICLDSTTFSKSNTLPRCGTFAPPVPNPSNEEILCALSSIRTIRHLTVRKDANVYLTLPKVGQFFVGLAEVVKSWDRLAEVYMAFRLSDDSVNLASIVPNAPLPPTSPSTAKSPLTTLTSALALSPRLESLVTHLPTIWNPVLVGLVEGGDFQAEEPGVDKWESDDVDEAVAARTRCSLKRIVLLPGVGEPKPRLGIRNATISGQGLGLSARPVQPSAALPAKIPEPPLPNSHYLATAAQKHPRLMNLIRAGWRDFMFGTASSNQNAAAFGVGRGRAATWAA